MAVPPFASSSHRSRHRVYPKRSCRNAALVALDRALQEVDMSLNGKHALITGASRGIGRGIALKLAESGAKVAIHYYQNENAAKETLAEIRKRGSDGVLVQADVTRPEQIARML